VEVAPRPRLDSHRLIEEFMVLANVAPPRNWNAVRSPACIVSMRRPRRKASGAAGFSHDAWRVAAAGQRDPSRDLDRVLRTVAGTDAALLVNEVVLRSQSQAAYNPDNIGHFASR